MGEICVGIWQVELKKCWGMIREWARGDNWNIANDMDRWLWR